VVRAGLAEFVNTLLIFCIILNYGIIKSWLQYIHLTFGAINMNTNTLSIEAVNQAVRQAVSKTMNQRQMASRRASRSRVLYDC
jgi:diacylglycerol kinase